MKELALLKVAAIIGCPFCIDLGSAVAKQAGITEKQLKNLALYSKSPEFSQVERVVLDLANAMTLTPAKVSEDLFLRLQEFFDPMQIVEITAAIAWENYRSRFNHALGRTSCVLSSTYCRIWAPPSTWPSGCCAAAPTPRMWYRKPCSVRTGSFPHFMGQAPAAGFCKLCAIAVTRGCTKIGRRNA